MSAHAKSTGLTRRLAALAGLTSVTAFAFFALTACGDVFADPEGTQIPLARADADAGEASAVFPNDTIPTCPTKRPRENSFCGATGSVCEFGESADMECNGLLACRGSPGDGYWEPRSNETCHRSTCPVEGDVASIDGKPCALAASPFSDADAGVPTDADEAVCNMTDGLCACTTGRDAKTAHERRWVCVRPISVCPPKRPMAGQPCTGSLYCDYGSCAFKRGLSMECKGGIWLTGGAPCP